MKLFKGFPPPSERMGFLWTLSSVEDLIIVEFGPEGTTRYLLEALKFFGSESRAKIFTTMMHEDVVVLGDNSRLLKTLVELDEKYSPELIVVMDSSVAAVIGVDLEGLCCEYQAHVGARLIPFCGGGLRGDWVDGVAKALSFLAALSDSQRQDARTYNILGCCVDEFNHDVEAGALVALMESLFGAHCGCVLSSAVCRQGLKNLGQASINLVLRREALPAAELLKENAGTPYVYGRPFGLEGTMDWIQAVENASGWTAEYDAVSSNVTRLEQLMSRLNSTRISNAPPVVLGGHPDIINPLREFVQNELGFRVECYSSLPDDVDEVVPYLQEDRVQKMIQGEKTMVAADGLKLRGIPVEKCLQTGYPILEELRQPALMGFDGAIYLAGRLLDVLQSE